MAGKRRLGVGSGADRLASIREGDEEAVPLRVDLAAIVSRKGLAEESALVSENVRVALPEFVQQPSRAFDVGEEESDSSSRELRHGAPPLRPRYAL